MFDYTKIKIEIEQTVCPTHKKHPELIIKDESNFSFKACCTEFTDQCAKQFQKLLADQATDAIGSIFK